MKREDTVTRFATIELHRDELKFSAGHLMLLSATQREKLHGHDYQLNVAFRTEVGENGLAFDLREYREKLQKICQQLDYRFILPSLSPYLKLQEIDDSLKVSFANDTFTFLKKDTLVLPITNTTLEELAWWFLQQLTVAPIDLKNMHIHAITVRIFNGRGESACCDWHLEI